jgi:PAS domain S-box-containing protein
MLSDPLILVAIVGTFTNGAAMAVAFWLWTQEKSDRYLLFWSLVWLLGTLRWLVHLPADHMAWLRMVEAGLLVPLMCLFVSLGSYDLLPTKPWRRIHVVFGTALLVFALGAAGMLLERPMETSYALTGASYLVGAACLWQAYRQTGLSGHLFAAAVFFSWFAWFLVGLLQLGDGIAKTIIGPLLNIPAALSLVVTVFQRRGRRLAESEHTLHKIFETAPMPLVIVRAPAGEIERANRAALAMLGVSARDAIGRTGIEHGLVADGLARQALYADLQAGRKVDRLELQLLGDGETRTVSVNADRIALEDGDRYIFSLYDLTGLRRTEDALRAAAEETRRLYVRLAGVEDEERRAIHAELHDKVGANLSALRLELDIINGLLGAAADERATRHLHHAREIAVETIAFTRDLMAELRPPALDDFGLLAGLRIYADTQSLRLDLPIDVSGEDLSPRPGRLVEDALFRIAQEAILNAARHGRPDCISIELGVRGGQAFMTVSDDGTGFDPAAPHAGPDHWGLKHMRERARVIGGALSIETAPQAGTRITATAPLGAA